MSKSAILKSSIVKKYWMALTGLFLIVFLLVHLSGNLQLLKSDDGHDFNVYAAFMTSFPLIKIVSYLLYASILFHAIDGIMLTIQNRKARPTNYAYNKASANSGWTSRNMALLGSIILVFLVVHMAQFWGQMHFADMPYMMDGTDPYNTSGELIKGATLQDGIIIKDGVDKGNGLKDLYAIVKQTYKDGPLAIVWVLAYVISMLVLALHLHHGFQSAFQTLGLNHPKYTPIIKKTGIAIAIIVPIGFAVIPLLMFAL